MSVENGMRAASREPRTERRVAIHGERPEARIERESKSRISNVECEKSAIGNRQSAIENGGFTLLEVAVAIALLGIALVVAVELLGVGLRSASASGDYTRAVLLAKQKVEEIPLQDFVPQVIEGTLTGGYRWSAEIVPHGESKPGLPARLFRLRVKVSWIGRGGSKGVELVTLRAAVEEQSAPSPVPAAPGVPAVPSGPPTATRGGIAR